MKKAYGYIALLIVTAISFGTAIAHLSCIYFGPACYAAQMAPEAIIESAQNSTLFAPIATTIVSAVFVIIGLYCLSVGQFIKPLPLRKPVIYVISGLCIVRGILGIQFTLRHPEQMDFIAITASIVWLSSGLLLYTGYRVVIKTVNNKYP